ncbi:MAG: type I pantothenate kinase [Buchnera aphidicola (Melaphis rhois)]
MKYVNFHINIDYFFECLLKNILYSDIMYKKHYRCNNKKPYIIGISGSVASGKSTISKWLKMVLRKYFVSKNISIVTTDSFLYSNRILYDLDLMKKKGFPQTYNINNLIKFLIDIRYGIRNVTIPVYSHFYQDIIPNSNTLIKNTDIFIIEGLHVLNPWLYEIKTNGCFSLSDFFNFLIYINADDLLLKEWYLHRFLKLRYISKFFPESFFNYYSKISYKEAMEIATQIWENTNYENLKINILPTKEYANFIITKGYNHNIDHIQLRNKIDILYY